MPVKAMTKEQMLEYLQTHVYRDGDCLIWAGSVSVSGNPRITWNKKIYLARRLMLQLMGVWVIGKKVTESCDHKLCMNKAHLLVLSQKQVMNRAAKKGHWQVGAIRALRAAMGKASTAKLPVTEARNVMKMRADGVKPKDICAKYGIDGRNLNRHEKTWKRIGII